MSSLIALVPSLLLLIGAGITWLTRRQAERTSWGMATTFALLTWLSVLFILPSLPAGIELSTWRPVSLFASRLEISLDQTTWGILYAVVTGLLAVLLTAAARPAPGAAGSRTLMLAYTALAMLAIMAGNLLSVAILWMIIDLVSFLYLVARVEDASGAQLLVGRLAIDMSGTLLALAAAAASFAGTLELPFGARPGPLLPTVFLSLAVLLRSGPVPAAFHDLAAAAGASWSGNADAHSLSRSRHGRAGADAGRYDACRRVDLAAPGRRVGRSGRQRPLVRERRSHPRPQFLDPGRGRHRAGERRQSPRRPGVRPGRVRGRHGDGHCARLFDGAPDSLAPAVAPRWVRAPGRAAVDRGGRDDRRDRSWQNSISSRVSEPCSGWCRWSSW